MSDSLGRRQRSQRRSSCPTLVPCSLRGAGCCWVIVSWSMGRVVSIQTSDEVPEILTCLHGHAISALQVLGINSLKSMSPMPDALAGDVVESSSVQESCLHCPHPGS